jgi:ribosomal protein L3 glutamine methyltransferase
MTLLELVNSCAKQLGDAHLSFGHGTQNAFDEAAWLVLWRLGLPLDSALDNTGDYADKPLSDEDVEQVQALVRERIQTRKPAAYLTHEAWLEGFAFYVDERVIVPRSLIAELLVHGGMDYFLSPSTHKVLDLCTGNGSLAIIAAHVFPDIDVTGADLSEDALAVARINVEKHQLQKRLVLLQSDGLQAPALQSRGPFDLIVCNPPYVNANSMAELPPEYQVEPTMALDGNTAGGSDGMDFVRSLLQNVATQLSPHGVLVLEIGNERPNFEAAFPLLEVVWLETSAGEDQVCLITHAALTS